MPGHEDGKRQGTLAQSVYLSQQLPVIQPFWHLLVVPTTVSATAILQAVCGHTALMGRYAGQRTLRRMFGHVGIILLYT